MNGLLTLPHDVFVLVFFPFSKCYNKTQMCQWSMSMKKIYHLLNLNFRFIVFSLLPDNKQIWCSDLEQDNGSEL